MLPSTLFYIIISVIVVNFLIDKALDYLNSRHFNDEIPDELSDVYSIEEYHKSQSYKKVNFHFGMLTSVFSIIMTLIFFFFDSNKKINYLVTRIFLFLILETFIRLPASKRIGKESSETNFTFGLKFI